MLSLDDRVEMVLLEAWRLLPPLKEEAYIRAVRVEDLGAKHGSYAPDTGEISLSARIFWGSNAAEIPFIDMHGQYPAQREPYCSRALHVCLHECFHAIGYTTGMDSHPEWLALGGWEKTWEDRQNAGRYFERRPGWGDQGGSEWAYRKGAWFPREYSSKSPYEDFADCCTHIALGWHHGVTSKNGRAKIRHMRRHVWDIHPLEAATEAWRGRWG